MYIQEGTESLVSISLFVWKILRKNERGGSKYPPVRRGLKPLKAINPITGGLSGLYVNWWGGGRFGPLNLSNTKRQILIKQAPFDYSHRELSESP